MRNFTVQVAWLPLLAACGASGTPGPGADAHPTCDGRGFDAEAEAWSTPDYGDGTIWQPYEVSNCSGSNGTTGRLFYTTDLDADGKPDLVVTYDCAGGAVGTSRWDLHRNTGDGFATLATAWSLPPGFEAGELGRYYGYTCDDGALYAVMDLDGDGAKDLVVTSRCDSGPVGTAHWEVYRNTGDGFEATATEWALPGGFPAGTFFQAGWGTCGYGSERVFSTTDLTGDGRPDLVVTYACEAGPIGQDHWEVYENTGDGFASTPTAWALPSGYGENNPFYQTSGADCTYPQEVMYSTVDIEHDGKPDLVATYRCEAGPVGRDEWRVHRNTGAGFATDAVSWALPPGFADGDFATIADGYCNADEPLFSIADFDGQDELDLVVTWDCGGDDAALGDSRWDVYLGSKDGFSETPTVWTLPDGYPAGSFPFITRNQCDATGSPVYTTLDLDDDGALDFVVTYTCNDSQVGTSNWLRYPGTCE